MRKMFCFTVIFLVPNLVFGQTPEEAKATIAYIQSLQQADGSFTPVKADPNIKTAPSLRATSAAIRALKYFGGELQHKDKIAKFVENCFDAKTGGYSDVPGGKPEVFLTAVGLMAREELKNVEKASLDQAVKFLVENAKTFEEMRIAAGGLEAAHQFPVDVTRRWQKAVAEKELLSQDARTAGSALVLLLRIDATLPSDLAKAAFKVVQDGQRPDGGFGHADATGSDLETTYRLMRAFHMMKEKPKDVAKLKEFVAKCRNADGGYGVEPGKPSNIGATYYASIIGNWLK